MCIKKGVLTPLFWELFVLIISLMGVVIPIYILAKYLQQSPVIVEPNIPSEQSEPAITKTDTTKSTPILIASGRDVSMALVASSHTLMMQPLQYGGLQAKTTSGYQIVNSKAQLDVGEGVIGGQVVALAIPATLIGVVLAPEPEIPQAKTDLPGTDTNDENIKPNFIKRVDICVIMLSMLVWISGIFFNKFAGSLAEKLKYAINSKPKED